MIISHKHKFVSLHLPKTGGTSCNNELAKYDEKNRFKIGHPTLMELMRIKRFGNLRADYFKFTFVRNPFDRLVSAFFYISRHSRWQADCRMRKKFGMNNVSFSFFVKNILPLILKTPNIRPRHFKLQSDFFFEDNKNLLDFVGKFENLQEDFNTICDKIGIPRQKLAHKNKTKHKHYTEYYDEETKQIVAENYAKDIEYFGYEFGE
tara:strand:+ start:61 stop:678 length:618 start_codon:yes stop_codon:yes gene_type:complete